MKICFAAERSFTLKVLLFATAFLIASVTPLCAQPSSFGGLVIGIDGNPIAGVAVRAKPEGTNAAGLPTIVTQTDASGRYRFEAVPPGIYFMSTGTEAGTGTTLRTTLITSMESVFFLNSTGTAERGQDRIRVMPVLMGPARIALPEDTISSFDLIVIPSLVSVSGRLEIPPGVTLPPIRAILTRTASQTPTEVGKLPEGTPPPVLISPAERAFTINPLVEFTRNAEVQPDGAFQIHQVPPGTYVLRLDPNLGVPTATITVADQNIIGIALVGKSAGVRVGGSTASSDHSLYKDKFPEWVYLIARDATEFQPPQRSYFTGIAFVPDSNTLPPRMAPQKAFVDAAGVETDAPITPVQADGRFEFLAVPAGEYYIRAIPDTGIPESRITVTGDKDIDDIRVGRGARVRGEVVSTNSGTRPPDVIALIATRARGQSVSALVDANGSFEFPKMGAGTYRILIDGKVRSIPAEVTVGDEDAIFRVETPFKAWVPGRVSFDGPGPPSESLDVTRVALTNGYDAAIKPDGSFQIKSDEGEFNFVMLSIPEGYIVKSVFSGGANLLMEPVKVDLRIPTSEILVTLQYKPETSQ